jgi:4-amino-4-deoxy-L-arabinose transferase-like glycosyltransferase
MKGFLQPMPRFILICLFLSFCLDDFFSSYMMFDGVFYANISRNLAEGIGSFWTPMVNPWKVFYDHPPGSFWILSFFYKFFGESIWIEKIFSLMNILIIFFLTSLIYEKLKKKEPSFLPILFLVICPLTYYLSKWNQLENLLVVFSLLSSLFFLKSFEAKVNRGVFLFSLIASLFSIFAILVKGVLAFPVFFIPFFLLVGKKITKRTFFSLGLYFFILFVFSLFSFYYKPSYHLWSIYFKKQVLASLLGKREISLSYWKIYLVFLAEILPMFILSFLLFLNSYKKFIFKKESISFLLIALSFLLPLGLSPKNRLWFLGLSLPYFALFFALLFSYIDFKSFSFGRLLYDSKTVFFALLFLMSSFLYSSLLTKRRQGFLGDFMVNRTQETQTWIQTKACPISLFNNWPLRANLERHHKIAFGKTSDISFYFVDLNEKNSCPMKSCKIFSSSKEERFALYQCPF